MRQTALLALMLFSALGALAWAQQNITYGGLQTFSGGMAAGGGHPTLTTGACSGSAAAGGLIAGKFTAATCTATTYIISGLPTAPTGYTCGAWDQTTPADTLVQTANSTTSATLTATTVASDVIVFSCMGW